MVEQLIDFFKDYGYWGMGVLSFLSGSVVPIASEVLLLFFLGLGMNAVLLTIVATIGNTFGGITCFMLGYLADKGAVYRLLHISEKRMRRADRLIQKYGYWTAAFSFVPAIGEVVLVALGVMRVNKYKVIAVMALGKFVRYAFVAASFYGVASLFT